MVVLWKDVAGVAREWGRTAVQKWLPKPGGVAAKQVQIRWQLVAHGPRPILPTVAWR